MVDEKQKKVDNEIVTFLQEAEEHRKHVTGDGDRGVDKKKDGTTEKSSDTGDKKPKQRSAKGVMFGCLGLFLFLVLLTIAFLVIMLMQNPTENPLLQALGVEPALFKNLLGVLVNVFFGFLTLISLLLVLIGLFRRFTATKNEAAKKKSSLIMMVVGFLLGMFSVFMWIVLFFYVSQISVAYTGPVEIVSDPVDTVNLTAPIDIYFAATDIARRYTREGIVSYAWDLDGDGNYDDGTGLEIQHTYEDKGKAGDGVIPMGLQLTLGTGQVVAFEKLITIANLRSNVVVSFTPKKPRRGDVLRFDASKSTDPDGTLISYTWDFDGDGIVDETGEKVQWEYDDIGDKNVVLTVTDNNGDPQVENIVFSIAEQVAREVTIQVSPGVQGEAPYEVQFDASKTDIGVPIKSYTWEFGDSSLSDKGKKVKHIFQRPGGYEVLLKVHDDEGNLTEGKLLVTVVKELNVPIPDIQVEGADVISGVVSGEAPFSLTFDASGSTDDGGIVEYRWDTDGDGEIDDYGVRAEKTYLLGGTYTVRLIVVDNDAVEAELTVDVVVARDSIRLDVQPSVTAGAVPLEVRFDASGSAVDEGSIVSYKWDFGDGTGEILGSAVQSHLYSQIGQFVVTVTAVTNLGEEREFSLPIVVRNTQLDAVFGYNPQEVKSGDKVFFDASDSEGNIQRYFWDFGDGKISRVVKPEHVFELSGEYEVRLEVFDHQSNVSRKVMKVIVK